MVSQPQATRIFAEQRRAAGAVDVVVAEDRDAFAPLDRALQPFGRRLHVAHDEGIGHQVAQASDRDSARPPPARPPAPPARARSVRPARRFARWRARAASPAQSRRGRHGRPSAELLDIEKVAGGFSAPSPHPSRERERARPSPACGRRCRRSRPDEGLPPYPANRLAAAAPKNTMPESAVIQKLVGQSV